MDIYKNISGVAIFVDGKSVKAGDTIQHKGSHGVNCMVSQNILELQAGEQKPIAVNASADAIKAVFTQDFVNDNGNFAQGGQTQGYLKKPIVKTIITLLNQNKDEGTDELTTDYDAIMDAIENKTQTELQAGFQAE